MVRKGEEKFLVLIQPCSHKRACREGVTHSMYVATRVDGDTICVLPLDPSLPSALSALKVKHSVQEVTVNGRRDEYLFVNLPHKGRWGDGNGMMWDLSSTTKEDAFLEAADWASKMPWESNESKEGGDRKENKEKLCADA